MTEHTDKIKDVVITINGSVVGGCVDFGTEESQSRQSLYEYLNSNPYEIIKGKTKYMVTLKLTGNCNNYSVKEICFNFVQRGYTVTYYDCTLMWDRNYTQSGEVYREIKIEAGGRNVTKYQ
ncbi:MAG: hypothetical protein ACI4HM_00170 [Ruminococcus sp.]